MADQQHTIYFTEKVKGDSAKRGQKGFVIGETVTTSAVLSNTANVLVSYPFGHKASDDLDTNNVCAGKKIVVGMNVTTAYDDVVAILGVQVSYNGTDWVAGATAIADTTPNVTGIKQALVDLTSIYAPFFRLAFNTSGLNCGTSGKAKFFYAIPIE
jgi:hypothetical protein